MEAWAAARAANGSAASRSVPTDEQLASSAFVRSTPFSPGAAVDAPEWSQIVGTTELSEERFRTETINGRAIRDYYPDRQLPPHFHRFLTDKELLTGAQYPGVSLARCKARVDPRFTTKGRRISNSRTLLGNGAQADHANIQDLVVDGVFSHSGVAIYETGLDGRWNNTEFWFTLPRIMEVFSILLDEANHTGPKGNPLARQLYPYAADPNTGRGIYHYYQNPTTKVESWTARGYTFLFPAVPGLTDSLGAPFRLSEQHRGFVDNITLDILMSLVLHAGQEHGTLSYLSKINGSGVQISTDLDHLRLAYGWAESYAGSHSLPKQALIGGLTRVSRIPANPADPNSGPKYDPHWIGMHLNPEYAQANGGSLTVEQALANLAELRRQAAERNAGRDFPARGAGTVQTVRAVTIAGANAATSPVGQPLAVPPQESAASRTATPDYDDEYGVELP
jgi:hypothetical protein